jgi:hypothetical protein
MRKYRDKVPAVWRKRRRAGVKALLAAAGLAALAAWTGQGRPVAAIYSATPAQGAATGAAETTGPIASAIRGKCLDSYPGHARQGLVAGIDHCTRARAQYWVLPGDNTIRMRGKCLAVGKKSSGTGAVLADCNGSAAQFWEADGIVMVPGTELVNPWSGKCLNDPHGVSKRQQVDLDTCKRSAAQIWYLPPG